MEVAKHLAKNLRALYFGKNWTATDYQTALADLTWEEAGQNIGGCNSILTLVHHTTYYMKVQIPVLDGGALIASDKESFEHLALENEADWIALKKDMFSIAESYAAKIEKLPGSILDQPFADEKYGSYYRNIQGVIEHSHYHLGQIVLLKKLSRN